MSGFRKSWIGNKFLLAPVALLLAAFLLMRGILPSLAEITTDFPNYYTAARIVVSGEETGRLYDDAWFQQKMLETGFSQEGKFSPFPPATALLFVPLALIPPQQALQILTLFNLLLLIGCVFLLVRLFSLSTLQGTVLVLLGGSGLANCFRFGQLYILLSFLMLLALYLSESSKPVLAGLSAGALLPVKYFSIMNVLDFVVRRRWSAVVAAFVGAGMISVVSAFVMGLDVHREFALSVLPNHLQSNLSLQDPYSTSFQSLDSLLRRLFLFDAEANPRPLMHSAQVFFWLKLVIVSVVFIVTIHGIILARRNSANPMLPLAIMCLAGLFIAPATASYHFVLLWLPVGVLTSTFLAREESRLATTTLAAYAGIGFLPLSWFKVFEGTGLFAVFAYPRLGLLSVLFLLGFLACGPAGRRNRTL